MSRIEVIGNATLYLGDCREILPTLSPFDAVVTSPPYGDLREYGGHEKPNLHEIIKLLARNILAGGVIVWNTNDQIIDGSESGDSFRQALYAMECGLRLHDTMIYCKEGVTFPDANRYHPAFEYVFIFSKGRPTHFNGIKDWKNKSAGRSALRRTERNSSGVTDAKVYDEPREIPSEGLRRNWWIVSNSYTGETEGHPAPMPYSLASDHITTWTCEGDTIIDPFLGSGTTGIACAKLGRKFIGVEIEEKYFDIACRRIEEAQRQRDMFYNQAAQ